MVGNNNVKRTNPSSTAWLSEFARLRRQPLEHSADNCSYPERPVRKAEILLSSQLQHRSLWMFVFRLSFKGRRNGQVNVRAFGRMILGAVRARSRERLANSECMRDRAVGSGSDRL
jgi:hypothetical protein